MAQTTDEALEQLEDLEALLDATDAFLDDTQLRDSYRKCCLTLRDELLGSANGIHYKATDWKGDLATRSDHHGTAQGSTGATLIQAIGQHLSRTLGLVVYRKKREDTRAYTLSFGVALGDGTFSARGTCRVEFWAGSS